MSLIRKQLLYMMAFAVSLYHNDLMFYSKNFKSLVCFRGSGNTSICHLLVRHDSILYILVPCRGRECSHHAECVARGNQGICQCPTKCPDNVPPRKICASDGNTYGNECELNRGSCKQQKPLQIMHEGPCSEYCLFNVTDVFLYISSFLIFFYIVFLYI